MTTGKTSNKKERRGIWPLQLLNFFMADMQAGIGPFLGIFLLAHGWQSGLIGTVMTIGGVAGMIMTAPAGALVDSTRHKRMYVVVPGIFTVLAALLILVSQQFWLVSASQVATAIAGSAIGTAVIGITLGIVKQRGFNHQNGRNQAFNHAGNVAGAALSGWLGLKFGLQAIFWLSAFFGILTIITVFFIPAASIDDNAARGLNNSSDKEEKASGLRVLVTCKPLLVLAIALAFFHLGNGAMLPLYGLAGASKIEGDPASFVAMTIIIAQATMIVTSIIAMKMAGTKGYWLVLFISFLSLPLRGFIAAHMISHAGLYPVQILDGIGAGLQSVAVPGLVARILNGSGRVNIGQGAVMTVQGIGAAVSPAIGGWMAQVNGYPAAFMILGSFAFVSIALWLIFAVLLKPPCAANNQ